MSGAVELLAGLVLDSGRRWGEAAESWQWADARAVLEPDGDRRYHFLTRPRGGSKTCDLAGVAVAALLEQAPTGARCYALASDRDQGALLLDSVRGFTDRTPGLSGALKVDAWRVSAPSGASLEVLAADEASSWGLRPWLAVVDDLAYWADTQQPRRLWRSIFSALPKVVGSRLTVLTSAGDPAHWAHDVLVAARASPQRWRVSEVEGPVPWADAADLAEQQAMLPDWEFERLHLNRWRESDDRLTSADDLRACVTLDGPREPAPGRRYAVGVDLGLKADRTAVAVCSVDQAEPSVVALDRMAVWEGSRRQPVDLSDVEAWLAETLRAYRRAPVVVDPWQAAQLTQRLRARGARVVEHPFTQQSVSRLALRLHQLAADRALALPDDADLVDELANVRLRETSPGVYRLDHDPGRHDDRAIALALAAAHLADSAAGKTTVEVPRGRIGRRRYEGSRSATPRSVGSSPSSRNTRTP